MEIFNNPNIPKICSGKVIADARLSEESVNTLNNLGITVIPSYKSDRLLPPIYAHPDMTILNIGGGRFVCSPDSFEYYSDRLTECSIIKGSVELQKDYPKDVTYNITIMGDFVFLNAASNQTEIFKTYIGSNKKILNVKQGYTKCNICIVGSEALITSDTGIYKAALASGIDALKIDSGYIELKGMSCGFIGGASGLIAPDILAVNGDIKTHPNANDITAFCKNHGVNIIPLKKGVLEDVGSILPIFNFQLK